MPQDRPNREVRRHDQAGDPSAVVDSDRRINLVQVGEVTAMPDSGPVLEQADVPARENLPRIVS
jgi:hypothetical protein